MVERHSNACYRYLTVDHGGNKGDCSMNINVQAAFEAFIKKPKCEYHVSNRVYLKATFKRIYEKGVPNWYVTVRAIDKDTGKWFSASASPFSFSRSRGECLRSALVGLTSKI